MCEGNRENSLDIFSLKSLVNIAEIERKRMTRPIKYTDKYFMDWILCNGFGARVSIIKLVATVIIMMNQKNQNTHTHTQKTCTWYEITWCRCHCWRCPLPLLFLFITSSHWVCRSCCFVFFLLVLSLPLWKCGICLLQNWMCKWECYMRHCRSYVRYSMYAQCTCKHTDTYKMSYVLCLCTPFGGIQ